MTSDFYAEYLALPDKRVLGIVAARSEFHPDAVEAAMQILKERNIKYEHLLIPPPEPVMEEPIEEEREPTQDEIDDDIAARVHAGQDYDAIRDETKGKGVNAFDLLQKNIDEGVIKDDTSTSSKVFWKNAVGIFLVVAGLFNLALFSQSGEAYRGMIGVVALIGGVLRLLRPVSK